ncbi:hypothetical protein GmHk_18G050342 [Glycine max]|nr:hypothetical protein GmHk_18G050342 [Glycine max]
MYNELQELSMQRNLFQISFWVLFAREWRVYFSRNKERTDHRSDVPSHNAPFERNPLAMTYEPSRAFPFFLVLGPSINKAPTPLPLLYVNNSHPNPIFFARSSSNEVGKQLK